MSPSRRRRALVLALVLVTGLAGALGVVLERRRARFRAPAVTFDVGQDYNLIFFDDETLVTFGEKDRVRFWSLAGGTAVLASTVTMSGIPPDRDVFPDVPLVAIPSPPDYRLVSLATGETRSTLTVGGTSHDVPKFSLSGKLVAVGWLEEFPDARRRFHARVKVQATETGAVVLDRDVGTSAEEARIAVWFDPAGDRLHVAFDRRWLVFSLRDGEKLSELPIPPWGAIHGLSSAGELTLHDFDRQTPFACSPRDGAVRPLGLETFESIFGCSRSGKRLLALETNAIPCVLDVASGSVVWRWPREKFEKEGYASFDLAPSGERFAVKPGGTSVVQIWELPPE